MAVTYINGKFVEGDDAQISVFDFGLQLGIGLFETLRTYSGRFFRLEDHIARMLASAAELRIGVGLTAHDFAVAAQQTVQRNGLADARVRITVTPGRRPAGPPGATAAAQALPTTIITAAPFEPYPAELYRDGMTVVISDIRQNETDPAGRHKTIAYLTRMLARDDARKKGAGEALFFNTQKHLAEGAITNVFLVLDDELATPDIASGVLAGITRKVVLELAAAAGIKAAERTLAIQDVLKAKEVFLTNSAMELLPVSHVERHAVGDGKPGPVYKRLHEAYRAAVAAGAAGGNGR